MTPARRSDTLDASLLAEREQFPTDVATPGACSAEAKRSLDVAL
jgi:hypothetical protein